MKKKMYKLSKIPISDWKHGSEHSHKVDQLTIGRLLSDEYEDLIPADILDDLYYHLLDNKAIRKKLRGERG
tara:strand:- start:541 stop:753 length:213 start_codon:yes stop_codon:yes gene_type:complete